MKFSELLTKTAKGAPSHEVVASVKLLTRGGFIFKNMAGVYSYLPLGVAVLRKIENLIRQSMSSLGAQEVHLNVLQDRALWEQTGRWRQAADVMYQFKAQHGGQQYGLGFTHEEVVAQIARQHIASYRDLPRYLYQIQTKFRNESRVQAGLLRGREFGMKDLYSLTATERELDEFYEATAGVYLKLFSQLGLDAIRTKAAGGLFSKYSDEFQVVSEVGEDTIFVCPDRHCAINKELINDLGKHCPDCKKNLLEKRAIELGNIFKLGSRFSEPLGLIFTDKDGSRKPVVMGSYGIGTGRAMAAIVEAHHDEHGIIWPRAVAPFTVHLIALGSNRTVRQRANQLYDRLKKQGIEALYDDRQELATGEQFADADLIGCPYRLVVSAKTGDRVEVKRRNEQKLALKSYARVVDFVRSN